MAALAAVLATMGPATAQAQAQALAQAQVLAEPAAMPRLLAFMTDNAVVFPIFIGSFAFAMLATTWLIRERRSLDRENRELRLAHADLKSSHERLQVMLDVPEQLVVVWHGNEEPSVRGTMPERAGVPADMGDLLDFPSWMAPDSALSFQMALGRLRSRAEAFEMTLETTAGTVVEAQGRASGPYAFVRFLGLSGDRAALASLETQHARLVQTTDSMSSLLEAISLPVWLRDGAGHIIWANPAYARAVEAPDAETVCARTLELLDATGRAQLDAAPSRPRAAGLPGTITQARVPATVAGDRRALDVTTLSYGDGLAGVAVDMSEVEEARREMRQAREAQARMLDTLDVAVVVFDERRRVTFRNQAFLRLFELGDEALAPGTDHAVLLDRLRTEGKLADSPQWPVWRESQFAVYGADVPLDELWHLPDARTLRVVLTPQRHGGLFMLLEDITGQLSLESRNKTLLRVQGETLDSISAGVAVFSADGRLRLSNPAFQNLFGLSDEQVAAATPIAALAASVAEGASDAHGSAQDADDIAAFWERCTASITGAAEARGRERGRLDLPGGTCVDWALVPLPNSQSMLTFDDVSDTVAVEKVLSERAETLQAAERLKSRFLNHVSYELRAPLTSIKGYAELLEATVGDAFDSVQNDYLGSIQQASGQLHKLVDDLIDLAAMDAGRFELDAREADLTAIVTRAAEGLGADLRQAKVRLATRLSREPAAAVLDPERVGRVVRDLLANALRHSPPDETVLLETFTDASHVCLRVADRGPGIPKERRATIFERFEGDASGGGKRGAGLGLSVARALVELHGGTIEVEDADGPGASFLCRFPRARADLSAAA